MSTTDTDGSIGVLCNAFIEEFISAHNLTILDKCPVCDHYVGRHQRQQEQRTSNGSEASITSKKHQILSATTIAIMKLQSQFPTFDKTTDVRTFLQRIELVLDLNEGIPRSEWSKVFLYIIKDITSGKWIKQNIIDAQLDWEEAKKKFVGHFQRAEYTSQLMNKYTTCKQLKNETVQEYSDKFTDIITELDRKDDDLLIISHYITHLHADIQKKFQYHLTTERIKHMDRNYQYTSLDDVINICIMYDIQSGVSSSHSATTSSSETNKSAPDVEQKANGGATVYCDIHKSSSHSTSECRSNGKRKETNSTTGATDKSGIRCFKCQIYGHYLNECPNENQSAGTAAVSPVPNAPLTTIGKREITPPTKLSYSAPGVQTNVTVKTATISTNDTCSLSDHGSSKAHVWLHDGKSSRKFRTLIDTGANTSFIDGGLASALGLKITLEPGSILLASSTVKSPRCGVTAKLDLTAGIENGDGGLTLQSISHEFQIMNLDVNHYEFIIGTDLLPLVFPNGIPIQFYSNQIKQDSPSTCGVVVADTILHENTNIGTSSATQMSDLIPNINVTCTNLSAGTTNRISGGGGNALTHALKREKFETNTKVTKMEQNVQHVRKMDDEKLENVREEEKTALHHGLGGADFGDPGDTAKNKMLVQ
jgi:hypothetical protein